MGTTKENLLQSLAAVVQHSDDIIVVKDLDLRVIATNNTFAKIVGKEDYKELLGKTDAEIFGVTPDTEPIRSYMKDEKKAQKLKKGEQLTCVEPVVMHDGSIRQYFTRKYPIYDGDTIIGTGNISVDVTEQTRLKKELQDINENLEKRVQTEVKEKLKTEKVNERLTTALEELKTYQAELLAQNEELIEKDKRLETLNQEFSSLFQDAPIAYMVIDKNLEIKKFNKLADIYFSFSNINRITKSLFSVVKKQNIEQLISWVSNEKYNTQALEINMFNVNKGERRFKLYGKKYMIDENYFLISLTDITESYEIKTNLEKRVQKEVEEKLEQERFIIQQSKLASMGEMIDAIAHQWLNPISVIKLHSEFTTLLLEENCLDNTNQMLEHQKSINTQIDHLVNTLEEFRSFYRPDSDSKSISVKSLIESTLLLMEDELLKHSITYSISQDNDFEIKVIKNQFKHVIINLVNNSKDAFEENAIETKHIEFTLISDDKFNIIQYSDNAGGIPLNVIDKIFEPNFTTKENGKGTGVGLYLCKQILDKFSIEIDVMNNSNGATFSIKSFK